MSTFGAKFLSSQCPFHMHCSIIGYCYHSSQASIIQVWNTIERKLTDASSSIYDRAFANHIFLSLIVNDFKIITLDLGNPLLCSPYEFVDLGIAQTILMILTFKWYQQVLMSFSWSTLDCQCLLLIGILGFLHIIQVLLSNLRSFPSSMSIASMNCPNASQSITKSFWTRDTKGG